MTPTTQPSLLTRLTAGGFEGAPDIAVARILTGSRWYQQPLLFTRAGRSLGVDALIAPALERAAAQRNAVARIIRLLG